MSTNNQIIPIEKNLSAEVSNPNKPDQSQRILDEDSYVDNISHIITRDFYPDLHRLNQQNDKNNIDDEYVQTLSSFHRSDNVINGRYNTPKHTITHSPIKQSNNNNDNSFENAVTPTPNQSNSTYSDDEDDDESHYVNGEELTQIEKTQMQSLKLNQFHSVYTSEDNHSFSQIMHKNEMEHIAKHEWIYKQQKNAKNRQKYLTLLKQKNNANDKNKNKNLPQIALSNAVAKNKNLSNSEMIKLQNKKMYENELEIEKNVNLYRGELEYWKYSAINKLMFFAETDKNLNAQMMNEVYAKYGKPECIYPNTRLPKTFKLDKTSKNELSEMEKQCKGYEFVYDINESPIALNENNQPKGPLFHIAALPKKDEIVNALNKKKSDKMKKKQSEFRKYTTPKTGDIYTPYHTKSVLTPSGNRIDTPLVGQNLLKRKRSKKDKNNNQKSVKQRRMSTSIRSVDNLSPAARKLMEMRMKGNDRLSTPLSSALRDAYSVTPNTMKRSNKRTRQYSVDSVRSIDTPQCTPKHKKRKVNDSEFMKPTHSLTSRHKKKKSSNITDGLL